MRKEITAKEAFETLSFPRTIEYGRYNEFQNSTIIQSKDIKKNDILKFINISNTVTDYPYAIMGNMKRRERYGDQAAQNLSFEIVGVRGNDMICYESHDNEGKRQTNKIDSRFNQNDFKLRRIFVDSSIKAAEPELMQRVQGGSGIMTTETRGCHFYVCDDAKLDEVQRYYEGQNTQVITGTELKEIFG